VIPAALRRREATRRGLSVRLRAEARVLRGLCALAESAGYLSDRVECVEHYCETLEGWCLGARTPHQLRGAHQMLLARRSTETEPPSATASLLLLRCALTMGKRASWFGHLPTHAPRDASAPERRYLVDTADALVALGVTVDRDAARVDAAQRYRVQVDALVGLTRTPNRFAALDAMEGR
jgi:hypothetical protein